MKKGKKNIFRATNRLLILSNLFVALNRHILGNIAHLSSIKIRVDPKGLSRGEISW